MTAHRAFEIISGLDAAEDRYHSYPCGQGFYLKKCEMLGRQLLSVAAMLFMFFSCVLYVDEIRTVYLPYQGSGYQTLTGWINHISSGPIRWYPIIWNFLSAGHSSLMARTRGAWRTPRRTC